MVSDEDYERLSQFTWSLHKRRGRSGAEYPVRHEGSKSIFMHIDVLPLKDGLETSHEDANPLNNQRCNLERRTRSQNRSNRRDRLRADNKTGVRGLWWDKRRNAFEIYVKVNGKKVHGGRFADKSNAITALDALLSRCGLTA